MSEAEKPSALERINEATDARLAKHEEILGNLAADMGSLVKSVTRCEQLLEELLDGERKHRRRVDERLEQLEARWANGAG